MIRPLREEDWDTVIAVVNEAWRTTYAGYVSPAMLDGAGCAERGRRLLDFAEQCARERGYARAVIWAFRENTRAAAFYQSRGYRADREEYMGEPYRAWGIRRIKQLDGEGEGKP